MKGKLNNILALIIFTSISVPSTVYAADNNMIEINDVQTVEEEENISESISTALSINGQWKQSSDGRWYYLHSDGSYTTNGWELINNKWYLFDKSGWMLSGWQKSNGSWYYLGASNDGSMKSGWQKINNKWYYLGAANDGAMKYGWKKINENWYYLGSANDGSMKSGWQKINNNWYYFGEANDGAMKYSWRKINNDWYYFGTANDGAMKTNQWIDEFYVGEDGIWLKDYSETTQINKISVIKINGSAQLDDEKIVLTHDDDIKIVTDYINKLSMINVESFEETCGGGGYSILIEYNNDTSRICYFTDEDAADEGCIMISNEKYYRYLSEDLDNLWNEISKTIN